MTSLLPLFSLSFLYARHTLNRWYYTRDLWRPLETLVLKQYGGNFSRSSVMQERMQNALKYTTFSACPAIYISVMHIIYASKSTCLKNLVMRTRSHKCEKSYLNWGTCTVRIYWHMSIRYILILSTDSI